LPCLPHGGRQKVGHELANIEFRFPIFRAVVDTNVGIVAVGNGLLEAKQGALLSAIGVNSLAITTP
jgi:hypothetical protein